MANEAAGQPGGADPASTEPRRILDAAPIGYVEIDPSATIRMVNPAFCEIVGFAAQSLLGRSLDTLVAPADWEILQVRLAECVADGANRVIAARVIGRGARPREIRIHTSRLGNPEEWRLLLACVDETDQRAAERMLRESERRYRTMFLNSTDAIIVFDPSGRCVDANPAARRLLRIDTLGDPFEIGDAFPEEERADTLRKIEVRRTASTPGIIEVTLRSRKGRAPAELFVAPAGGGHFQIVLRDLSERRAMEADRLALDKRLHETQKMDALGRLAGGVVHDVNNILGAISNYAALIAATASDRQVLEDAEAVLGVCKRGKALTGNLLRFTRGGEARSRIDLRQTTVEAVDLLRHAIPRTVTVAVEPGPQPCFIVADPAELIQVIMNLGLNSAQAMPNGGVIRVAVSGGAFGVVLTVSDTGCGIPEEIMHRVMEPFFSTKPAGAGTGLGLSIVYGVVRGLGGEVTIESRVGAGTTVTATFPPGIDADSVQRTPVPVERTGVGRPRRALALVCDDDTDVLAGTRRLLGLLGLETEAAHNGHEAVSRFGQLRPRLVVMDLDMPGMDGSKVIEKILALDSEARILVITGYGHERLPPEVRDLPWVRYLRKPASLGELSAEVDELLR